MLLSYIKETISEFARKSGVTLSDASLSLCQSVFYSGISFHPETASCTLCSNFLCGLVICFFFFVNCVFFVSMFCCVLKVALQARGAAQL